MLSLGLGTAFDGLSRDPVGDKRVFRLGQRGWDGLFLPE